MSFSVSQRVKVSSQHSEFRNLLGTVEGNAGGYYQVRLDGEPAGQTQQFQAGELNTTTLACPLDYTIG